MSHNHNNECCNEHDEHGENRIFLIVRLCVSLLLLLVGVTFFKNNNTVNFILLLISFLVSGYDILFEAMKKTIHLEMLDEDFLMSIASVGAFAIGEHFEAVLVMLLFQIGEMLQDLAVDKSKSNIRSLVALRPDYANLKTASGTVKKSPKDIVPGDTIVVYPGEKIPLDGIVASGTSSLNTSALTGESLPKDVFAGDRVLSGCININSVLEVNVDTSFSESTVSRILNLVENSSENKSSSESFIRKFAKIYTPVVVILAVIICVIPPLFFHNNSLKEDFLFWINKGLSFLVVSCPCALVISVPLSYFGGIGGASREGILVKGGNYLEAIANAKTFVWDKTGTLTKGQFEVVKIVSSDEKTSEDDLLKIAAHMECHSPHPIARSLVNAYGQTLDENLVSDTVIYNGRGIKGKYADLDISIGNEKIMIDISNIPQINEIGTCCHIAINNKYAGYILIADTEKEDSKEAIDSLRQLGATQNILVTGDSLEAAEAVKNTLNLDLIYAKCLPDDKVKIVEDLKQNESGPVVFTGDGMNDAYVLTKADIGIAMGAFGSDAAIEAADIVIMNDKVSSITKAVKIARKTRKIATENIIFSIAVKILVLILIVLGLCNMYIAVFADVGVCLIAVLNSARTLKIVS